MYTCTYTYTHTYIYIYIYYIYKEGVMFACNPQVPRNGFCPPRVMKPPPPWLPRTFEGLHGGLGVNSKMSSGASVPNEPHGGLEEKGNGRTCNENSQWQFPGWRGGVREGWCVKSLISMPNIFMLKHWNFDGNPVESSHDPLLIYIYIHIMGTYACARGPAGGRGAEGGARGPRGSASHPLVGCSAAP